MQEQQQPAPEKPKKFRKKREHPEPIRPWKVGQRLNNFLIILGLDPPLLLVRHPAKPSDLRLELGVGSRRDMLKFCALHGITPPEGMKLISIDKSYEMLDKQCPGRYIR